MNGVDFSYWRPGVGWLKANGYGFATRYLCWRPNPKVIDKAEFDSYRAAGIDVVLNWEWDIGDMLGGAANGTAFATEARKQAEALGAWPCPIYFSCDTDAQPWQQPTVNDFLRAAGAVLGGAQYVGIYGGYGPVSRAMQAGVARFGWQTYAWSGGQWYAQAQLRQTGGVADYGFDFSLTADFGQVGGSSDMTPEESDMLRALRDTLLGGARPGGAPFVEMHDKVNFLTSQLFDQPGGSTVDAVRQIQAQVAKLSAVTGTDPAALARAVVAAFRDQLAKP